MVSDQNSASLICIMLEIHHSGREPSKLKKEKLIDWCPKYVGNYISK